MNKIIIILFILLLVISFYINSNSSEPPDKSHMLLGSVNPTNNSVFIHFPNSSFEKLRFTKDKFSDVNGYRPYPWGFEPITGNISGYFKNGTAIMIGTNDDDASLFAVPDLYYDKPVVIEGYNFTLAFDIKLTNVSGHGVRLMQQWFETIGAYSGDPEPFPYRFDYSDFETGTTDWHTVSYTVTAPPGAIRGDPVIELWGKGMVEIKKPIFFVNGFNETDTKTLPLRLKNPLRPLLINNV